ncbi:MAG: ATP-dependent helicase [Promethearchaeota archaeon]
MVKIKKDGKKKKIILKKRPGIVPERYKKELNPEQYSVVVHEKGAALVIAGAGTGKTRALTYRVAYLLDNKVPPDSIILVTFTKKAAQEMTKRVEKLAGSKTHGLKAGTFHHIANTVLRRYAKTLDLQNNFTILDRSDQKELMKIVLGRNISKDDRKRYPKSTQLIEIYSKRINLALKLEDSIDRFYPQYFELKDQIKRILDDYDTAKRAGNQMDFDDLLLYFLAFLQKKTASKNFKKSIRHVLVDEFQDVNAVQAKIVYELSSEAETLTVVGDDAQSIYKFRGADFTHMLNFPERLQDTTKYKLEQNYRSTPEILNLANASIAHNENQFKKNLRTTRPSGEKPMMCPCEDLEQEAMLICQMILKYRDQGIDFHEQAVLFRAGFHRIQLEQELIRENIPYEVRAGVRFFEQAHIKDLMAYLAVIVNPADSIQWMRVISKQDNIGNTAAQKVIDLFSSDSNQLEQFVNFNLPNELKGKRLRKIGIQNLVKLQKFYKNTVMTSELNELNKSNNIEVLKLLPEEKLPPLPDLTDKIIEYLSPIIKLNYKNWEDRLRDLRELVNFTAKYSNISAFISDIITQFNIMGETIEEGDPIEDEKPLVLTTIHQAKGLEWRVVFLMNLAEGRMPSSRSIGDPEEIEEERRLFYVACTRAKDHLILSYPIFVPKYNYSNILSGPSRFLEEIKDNNIYERVEVGEEY